MCLIYWNEQLLCIILSLLHTFFDLYDSPYAIVNELLLLGFSSDGEAKRQDRIGGAPVVLYSFKVLNLFDILIFIRFNGTR